MKASIITPTHNPKLLHRAAAGIAAQTGCDIEWIILCNGPAQVADVEGAIHGILPHETRVNILRWDGPVCGVGQLKLIACNAATGDFIVELDHDDELMPGCIEHLARAFHAGHGFVSSATIEIKQDGGDVLYGAAYGWEHRETEWGGRTRRYNVPFPATARSLCEIYYAPNHVRAWDRKLYHRIGGHDPSLAVADDMDLMIRFYLAGASFCVIDRPLYVQRFHGDNTQHSRNGEIQQTVATLKNRYIRQLVDEQCRRNNLPKIDLGAAHGTPDDGWIKVDALGGPGVLDIDVTNGLPWSDNSVFAVRAHDFLEHIPIGDVVPLMNEIHRVLVPGGWLLTSTPSTDGRGAFQDPTHCSFWNENSWWYYTRSQQAKYVPAIKARFSAARLFTHYPSQWHEQHQISYVVADLVALKGQREPGLNGFC